MEKPGTKEAAESVLRELPSVVGAFVREDAYGNPREIHLLIKTGPRPAHLARDVKDLLEERLGIPIDQRIISIAQLAGDAIGVAGVELWPEGTAPDTASAPGTAPGAASEPESAPSHGRGRDGEQRLRFLSAESEHTDGRIIVRVRFGWEDGEYVGEAVELEAGSGRVRAGATAAIRAANAACDGRARFELEAATVVRALDRDYAMVTALASSPALGRQPLMLSGAKPVDELEPIETAAVLATLKALNRVLGMIIRIGPPDGWPRRP
ncbi:MAG: hypothetical protein ACRELX_19315 [Longimicrobiales bacterium]